MSYMVFDGLVCNYRTRSGRHKADIGLIEDNIDSKRQRLPISTGHSASDTLSGTVPSLHYTGADGNIHIFCSCGSKESLSPSNGLCQ